MIWTYIKTVIRQWCSHTWKVRLLRSILIGCFEGDRRCVKTGPRAISYFSVTSSEIVRGRLAFTIHVWLLIFKLQPSQEAAFPILKGKELMHSKIKIVLLAPCWGHSYCGYAWLMNFWSSSMVNPFEGNVASAGRRHLPLRRICVLLWWWALHLLKIDCVLLYWSRDIWETKGSSIPLMNGSSLVRRTHDSRCSYNFGASSVMHMRIRVTSLAVCKCHYIVNCLLWWATTGCYKVSCKHEMIDRNVFCWLSVLIKSHRGWLIHAWSILRWLR